MNLALVTCLSRTQYAVPGTEDEDNVLARALRERGHVVSAPVWTCTLPRSASQWLVEVKPLV